MTKKKAAQVPECCGQPMVVNQRVNRVSGPRIVYLCRGCGKTKTVKVEG